LIKNSKTSDINALNKRIANIVANKKGAYFTCSLIQSIIKHRSKRTELLSSAADPQTESQDRKQLFFTANMIQIIGYFKE